jgi:hypothetical protein
MPAGAGGDAQLLDDPECLFAFQPSDYATEGAGKPAHVLVER